MWRSPNKITTRKLMFARIPSPNAFPRNVIGIGDKSAMVLMDKLLKKI
jgi:hypothetical protein